MSSPSKDPKQAATFKQVVRVPVYRQVADQLREAILDGAFAPGQPIPSERELVGSFGVSRASVREAIRSLVAEGLLVSSESAPMRAVVASDLRTRLRTSLSNILRLHGASLNDVVELRLILETAAVRRTAERSASVDFAEIESALDAMREIDGDIEEFDAQDVRFHLALAGASGNEALYPVMLAIRDNIAHHLLVALGSVPDPPSTLRRLTAEHTAIYEAVAAGQGNRAADLMAQHVARFYAPSDEATR